MALNGVVLGAALKAALTLTPSPGESSDAFRTRVFTAMGNTIVAHIVTNGLVVVTVASVTGVITGPSVSGPGTGTGTIT